MKKEIELKALEAIENIPMPPKSLPYVVDDKMVEIPSEVMEYWTAMGIRPKERKIKAKDYLQLLKDTGIGEALDFPIAHYTVIK